MCRVIREARPAWIIGENVAGIVNLALDTVCADLEAEGYEVEPIIVPACAVDAPHRRDRVWIVANTKRGRCGENWEQRGMAEIQKQRANKSVQTSEYGADVADTVKQGREGRVHRREDTEREGVDGYSGCGGTTYGQSGEAIWLAEPNVGRVANGIPNRSHRLKGLGNAIVPQVAAEIIRCINKVMEDKK
jgi:DNA (cytosine-5)-methyltransferase 1